MASYHCTVKVGKKGKAAPHAKYISREGKYANRNGMEEVEHCAFGNLPKWAKMNPINFWKASDDFERENGSTYREFEVALPRELTKEQRIDLVKEYAEKELGDKHAYQWAIHIKKAMDGQPQPHVHFMYSERVQDGIEREPEQYFKRYNGKKPETGGCKKDSAGTDDRLEASRQLWADIQNQYLERFGHKDRVDHRSYKEREIDRVPEMHLGWNGASQLSEQDKDLLLARRVVENKTEIAMTEVKTLDLSAEIAAAIGEGQRIQDQRREEALARIRDKATQEAKEKAAQVAAIEEAPKATASRENQAWAREVLDARKKAPAAPSKAAAAPVPDPQIPLAERIKRSLESAMQWVRERFGEKPVEEIDPALDTRYPYGGTIVRVKDEHAIMNLGRKFGAHRLDALSKIPTEGQSVNIQYRGGKGTVIEPEVEVKYKGPSM